MFVILFLGLVGVGATVVLLFRALTAPTSRSATRQTQIDAYGFSAQPAAGVLGPPEGPQGGIADLVAKLGGLVAARAGRVTEADLRSELMAAGMYTTSPRTLLGYRVIAAILLPLSLLVIGAAAASLPLLVLLAAASMLAGWMLPLVLVRRRARTRMAKVDRTLPELIDLLVVTVEAGLALGASLRVASREFEGPLHDELLLTLQEQTMGLSTGEALTNMLARCDTPAMRSFVRAVIQGETMGVSTGQIMRNLAVEMRKRRRANAERQAQQAPIKMLFPLVFLIFPTLFIVLLAPALFQLGDAFK